MLSKLLVALLFKVPFHLFHRIAFGHTGGFEPPVNRSLENFVFQSTSPGAASCYPAL
jgi:hypothetical protein